MINEVPLWKVLISLNFEPGSQGCCSSLRIGQALEKSVLLIKMVVFLFYLLLSVYVTTKLEKNVVN